MDEPKNAATDGTKNAKEERRKPTSTAASAVPPIEVTLLETSAAAADNSHPPASQRSVRSTASFAYAISRGDFDSALTEVRRALRRLKITLEEAELMKKISKCNRVMRKIILGALNEESFSMEQRNRIAHALYGDGIFVILSKYWSLLEINEASQWHETEQDKDQTARIDFLVHAMDATADCTTICDIDYLKASCEELGLFYFSVLRSPAFRDFQQSDMQMKIVLRALSSIHLLAQKNHEFCGWTRDNERASVVYHYATHPAILVQTEAILLSSLIVNSDEEQRKKVREGLIRKTVGVLRDCLKSASHAHYSTTYRHKALDVLKVLNRLAENDDDKYTVAALGALPLYGQLLVDESSTVEHKEACNGLWVLAFDNQNKQLIKQDEDCMKGLRRLRSSHDSAVKRAANGALWVLENEDMRVQLSEATLRNTALDSATAGGKKGKAPRIMISYNWKHKTEILKVKGRLEAVGYSIWIDEEQISGSTIEAMADAVEQATVVLMFFSEHYKASQNCRSEAEYCYKIKKPFIPIRVQRGYNADGWLGLLIGTKLYFDFTRVESWESTLDSLCKEIDKYATKQEESAIPTISDAKREKEINGKDFPALQLAESWTEDMVQAWLKEHGLAKGSECLTGFTGAHIVEMHQMQKSAPSFFYKLLNEKLQLPVREIVTFSMLLRKLK